MMGDIKIQPAAWTAAARSVAADNARAAHVDPGALPTATLGSPADAAWALIAAEIAAAAAAMTADLSGAGPSIEAATDTGASVLTANDAENATAIADVAATQRGV
jgi:hypothetical protein